MTDHSKFFRSSQTIKEYDGEDSSSSSSWGDAGEGDSDSRAIMTASQHEQAAHLFIMSLLEHLCSMYAPDATKSRQLFKVVCKQLSKMDVMRPLVAKDEFSSVRTQYRSTFAKLIQATMSTITQESPPIITMADRAKMFFQPRFQKGATISLADLLAFHTSRYRDEYEELGRLGAGAYGSVFKVKHKLDKLEYAIKKVAFQGDSPELWIKALREVQYLATMYHNSIIRYHGAWLEYQHPLLPLTDGKTEAEEDDIIAAITQDELGQGAVAGPVVPYRRETSIDNSIVFQEDSSEFPSYLPKFDDSLCDSSIEFDAGPELDDRGEEKLYGRSFVVLHIQMELCGTTLAEWLRQRNLKHDFKKGSYSTINEEECLHILKRILEGVCFIHSHGYIHRDLKPKNIFVCEKEENEEFIPVKIGDFGLARKTHSREQPESPMTPHPGRTGFNLDAADIILTEGVGTTIYAAPEQLKGGDYDEKSDMYSFGLVMLELYHPFKTEMERIHSLTDARKGILPIEFTEKWAEVAAVVKSLMNDDPDKRPTASDLLKGRIFTPPVQSPEDLQQIIRSQAGKLADLRIANREIPTLNKNLQEMRAIIKQKDDIISEQQKEIERLKSMLSDLKTQ